MTHEALEEGSQIALDFKKLDKISQAEQDVIPVAVQDADSKEVLIVAYVNEEALNYTLKNKTAAFWSTSRNVLWVKGKTSGNILEIQEVLINCEQNSLVYLVKLKGKGSCHTKDASGQSRNSCYYRKIENGKLTFK